jgi:deoxyadenosine/deoxycytidine kinase
MSKIINLFGGPGIGKSSIASGLVYKLKKNHISCDNPYEFPKLLAWDENFSAIQDQLYVLANQHRGIVKSYNKVDFIILDSPILLSLVYKNIYNGDSYPSTLYNDSFEKLILDLHSKYNNINIFLKRNTSKFNHNPVERYQDLEESMKIDNKIKNILDNNNIPYTEINVGKKTVNKIIKDILLLE